MYFLIFHSITVCTYNLLSTKHYVMGILKNLLILDIAELMNPQNMNHFGHLRTYDERWYY